MADISKIKTPDGTTYNIKDSTARANSGVTGVKGNSESSYRTGNVNLTSANVGAIAKNENGNTQQLVRPNGLRGSYDVTLQGLFNVTRANRLAYLPADQIIIEKTIDGGVTWSDAGFTDLQKRHLFAETRGAYLPLPQIDGKKNLLCGLRVTISAMKYNVPDGTAETDKYNYWSSTYVKSQERYTQLKEFYFWISAFNDTIGIKVERASGASPNAWSTCFEDNSFYMTGWSGSDYIRLNWQSTFGGGTTQTGNHWNYRFTFMTKGVNGTDTMGTGYETQAQSIADIRGYGDSIWGVPNAYMAYDRLYQQDVNQNATFPAKVTATSFSGNVTGNVTGSADTLKSGGRPTSANNNYHDGKLRYYLASASMTTGKPPEDAEIIHLPWDNGGWDTQIAVSSTPRMYIRKEDGSGNWDSWKMVYTDRETISIANGGTGATSAADARTNLGTPPTNHASTATTYGTGSSTNYGHVKLSSSTSSTSAETGGIAATPSAVRAAYNLANGANTTANTALSGVNGTLIYDHTYSITNGVATFVPHVYLKGEEVTSNYAASCFTWKYRLSSTSSGTPSYINLTTDSTTKGCTVAITTLGYGGYVLGTFTPPES